MLGSDYHTPKGWLWGEGKRAGEKGGPDLGGPLQTPRERPLVFPRGEGAPGPPRGPLPREDGAFKTGVLLGVRGGAFSRPLFLKSGPPFPPFVSWQGVAFWGFPMSDPPLRVGVRICISFPGVYGGKILKIYIFPFFFPFFTHPATPQWAHHHPFVARYWGREANRGVAG